LLFHSFPKAVGVYGQYGAYRRNQGFVIPVPSASVPFSTSSLIPTSSDDNNNNNVGTQDNPNVHAGSAYGAGDRVNIVYGTVLVFMFTCCMLCQ
jgi:hypothetical protein